MAEAQQMGWKVSAGNTNNSKTQYQEKSQADPKQNKCKIVHQSEISENKRLKQNKTKHQT